MDPPSATAIGQKIDNSTFRIVSILMTCIAICIVSIRLTVRRLKLSRFYTDDLILVFAAVTMIGGTVMVNLVLPYNQTEVDVGAGLIPPPADIIHILDYDVKFQDATVVLTNSTIFGVKFSFLFFFRQVLAQTGKLRMYWWFVVIFTIPCAVICACTEFMVCPAFGDNIMAVCVYSGLQRQIAVLYVTVVLDIVSDVLLISIPVFLLWNVRMNIRRKIGMGWLLCLSSFCIICAIIRAVGHNLVNGQNDVVWILFWSHMEACVALIACSMTVFRGLFKGKRRLVDVDSASRTEESEKTPRVEMPRMTRPEMSGLRSIWMWDPFEDREDGEERDLEGTTIAESAEHTSFGTRSMISSNATKTLNESSTEILGHSGSVSR